MKIKIEVNIYEIDGKDKRIPGAIIVRSHWNRDNMIVLEADGTKYTVNASDLRKAIDRSTGWKPLYG